MSLTSKVASNSSTAHPVPPNPTNYVPSLSEVLSLFSQNSDMDVVVSDSEYLNGSLATRARPGPEVWKEVVQIGAVKYRGGKPVGTFNRYVTPKVHMDMSEESWKVFTEITNIQKDTLISEGSDFEDVWKALWEFSNGAPVVVIAGDREVYKWNFRLLGQNKDEEIDALPWIILRPLLPLDLQALNSGDLYTIVGFTETQVCSGGLTTHNALFDATSMAIFLSHFKPS
jgi:hypothetical protein